MMCHFSGCTSAWQSHRTLVLIKTHKRCFLLRSRGLRPIIFLCKKSPGACKHGCFQLTQQRHPSFSIICHHLQIAKVQASKGVTGRGHFDSWTITSPNCFYSLSHGCHFVALKSMERPMQRIWGVLRRSCSLLYPQQCLQPSGNTIVVSWLTILHSLFLAQQRHPQHDS